MAATQNARALGFRNALPLILLLPSKSSLQQRAFSADGAVNRATGPVPKFRPTTNPELDAILKKIRDEHLIPPYLPQNYYRLAYCPKNHSRLAEDPITIKLDGEPYTLTPRLSQPGAPIRYFISALKLMREPADFAVLPELIRGYYQANSTISVQTICRVIRSIIRFDGNADILVEIARTARDNGLRFNKDLARLLLLGIRQLEQQPDRASVVKSLKYAEELLDIIGKCTADEELEPIRHSDDPIVLGTMLSIYADASLRSHEEWHEDNVERLLLQLRGVWENIEWDPVLSEANGETTKSKVKLCFFGLIESTRDLRVVLEGILQAKKVLSPKPNSSPMLGAGGELEAKNVKLGVDGEKSADLESSSPMVRKPKRVRSTDPVLLSWLKTESERLASLITRMHEFVDRVRPTLFPPREMSGDLEQGGMAKAGQGAGGKAKESVEIIL